MHEDISVLRQMRGGANSFIWKLTTNRRNTYIVKEYIQRPGDYRKRLRTEYYGLQFLWNHGIRNIPEPMAMNESYRIGIYRYINGVKIGKRSINLGDIRHAVSFLQEVHNLSKTIAADDQPIASAACFSIQEYINSIELRFQNLSRITGTKKRYPEIHNYLQRDFLPFYHEVSEFIRVQCEKRHVNAKEPLPRKNWTLNPNDCSFHNAMRKGNVLYFFDFEYFGWDDPTKVIAIFFTHPSLPIPQLRREYFLRSLLQTWGPGLGIEERLPLVNTLLSIEWCLIMLNVYLRKDLDLKIAGLQLSKAKKQLKKTIHEYYTRQFPLSLL